MGYAGSDMAVAFANLAQMQMRAMTGEGLDGRLGIKPRLTPQQAFARKALSEKNPVALRWLGFSEQGAKSAIEAYNPSFTGQQHSNPAGGGMTTRNQPTAPPRRRQGGSDDSTMLTGQDAIGGSNLLGA